MIIGTSVYQPEEIIDSEALVDDDVVELRFVVTRAAYDREES